MRIYLIGFMGAGKSSLGKTVAMNLHVPFLDTDELIEQKANMPISDIFAEKGEDEFRKIEAKIIRETLSHDKALIATGGGLPVYHNNMQWLLDHGITMYLKWPEELLLASNTKNRIIRPLLSGLSAIEAAMKAKDLLTERIPVYERASMTIEMLGELEHDLKTLERACKYIW